MLKACHEANLAQEALSAHRRTDLGLENLHRDWSSVLQVMGEIDCRHPAGAYFALDAVTITDGRLQLLDETRHAGAEGERAKVSADAVEYQTAIQRGAIESHRPPRGGDHGCTVTP